MRIRPRSSPNLEAEYPEPNLIPLAAEARARTIWFDELADTVMMAEGSAILGNRFVKPRVMQSPCDHDAADQAEHQQLPPILDYLERTIPDSGFLVEDRLTLADIAVASPLATLGCIGVCVDSARYPRTAAYIDAIHARDHAQVKAMGGPVAKAPATA
ncbi:glutathione S-transferase family protein [Sphingomonas elodea]|uniref:glutathione S-transferase family protein n=1 Tax=Sphingomonas elodea TaxID=179878 RepID=UPI0002631364|nr:glutathione S-transferase family protein [Sphingomonas elodea]